MSTTVAGYNPATWMTQMVAENPTYKQWPVTKFVYPGSHDACTWGSGIVDYSWKCQAMNLSDQLSKAGQRYFDIRLVDVLPGFLATSRFVAFHGEATNTAGDTALSENENTVGDGTFLDQILKFADANPGEIVILNFQEVQNSLSAWNKTIGNLLVRRCLPPNSSTTAGSRPTYAEAVSSARNIILVCDKNKLVPDSNLSSYYWDVTNPNYFLGAEDGKLWNESTWSTNDYNQVLQSILSFINDPSNQSKIQQHQQFWVAQFQLTPSGSFVGAVGGFLGVNRDVLTPRKLALGGIPLEGGTVSMGTNRALIYYETFNRDVWQKNSSIVQFDFAGVETEGAYPMTGYPNAFTSEIARMNFFRDD